MASAGGTAQLAAAFLPGVVLAVIGLGLPAYILQAGIRHTEPIATCLLLAVSPVFAYLMEFLDPRLHPSPQTLAGVLAIVALVAAGAAARGRAGAPSYVARHAKSFRLIPVPRQRQVIPGILP